MKTLAMLVAAVVLVGCSDQSQSKKGDKSDAITAIKKLGGYVEYDEKKPGKPVISVDLNLTKVTDAGLVHLKGLTKLQTLSLFNTKVTDAGLVHLMGLTNLQTLDLSFTIVTDAGVKKLQAALPKCKIIALLGRK